MGRIEAGYTTSGARRRISVTAATEAEVKSRLRDKWRAILKEGVPSDPNSRITVKSWADQWLPRHAKNVRPKAHTTDAGHVRRWIVPTIGHKRLSALTPADVRSVRTAIEKACRGGSTARGAHYALISMLRAALVEGHQVPARLLELDAPPLTPSDRDAIPFEHAVKILKAAARDPLTARWALALLQGIRQGEALGLTWDAVDLGAGTVDISWQLQALPYRDKKDRAAGFLVPDGYESRRLTGAYHLVRPKTSRGQRIIPLVPWSLAALKKWQDDAPANDWGLLFTATDTRYGRVTAKPRRDRLDRDDWYALQIAAGVQHASGRPYDLHECRHTTATLLLELGIDPEVIKAILGHSSIVTTRGYQHVSQELTRRAMADLGAKFKGLPQIGAGVRPRA